MWTLFGLKKGEGRKAALFCIVALLWGIGGYGTLTLSEGMLLQNVGAHLLPYTYLVVALLFFTLSSFLIYALNHLSVKNILLLIIGAVVSLQLIFYFFYPFYQECSFYWFAYKIYGWIAPVAIYICFWAFVDQYFDLQSGKRFFALFNAMLFLGDALGGASISYGLTFLEVRGLFLFYALLILASAFFIIQLSKRLTIIPEEPHKEATPKAGIRSLLSSLLRSRYTLTLILFYFAMQMLAIVTEFSYMEQFEHTLKSTTNEHQLTQFLGKVSIWVSLLNMCFGMFIYSRLVRKMGINNIIVIAPSFFMALFFFWLGIPCLTLALFGVVAREGMIYSLDDNNLNLLLAGVPTQIKNQVRFGVESFFEPMGMLLSACILLLFPASSKVMGLLIALVAFALVLLLRTLYTRAIFNNLINLHYKKEPSFIKAKNGGIALLYGAKQKSEKEKLLIFAELLELRTKRSLPALLNHLSQLSLPSRLKALTLLSESDWAKEERVIKKLTWWAKTTTYPSFKEALHIYFARHGLLLSDAVVEDLESKSLAARAAAIITLKRAKEHKAQATQKLRLLLGSPNPKEVVMALTIIGIEENEGHAEVLLPYLRHPESAVRKEAASSLAKLALKPLSLSCSQLISLLNQSSEKKVRAALIDSIKSSFTLKDSALLIQNSGELTEEENERVVEMIAAKGAALLQTLLTIITDLEREDAERLMAAKIACRIDAMAVRGVIRPLLTKDLERIYFYYYHAHTIQRQVPEQNLCKLEKKLAKSYESALHMTIELLTLYGGIKESEIMVRSLLSSNRKIRATAYETLEKVTPAALFAKLKPFLDEESSAESRADLYLREGGLPFSPTQLQQYSD